jgi:hypothetical protein
MDNTNNIITDQPVVNITIPTDSPGVTTSQNTEPQPEATPETISPSSPQDVDKLIIVQCPVHGDNKTAECPDCRPYKEEIKSHAHRWIKDSDNKLYCDCGERVDLQPTPKHAGGRPCSFCQHKEEYLTKAQGYFNSCKKGKDGKPSIPFVEDLAFELSTIDENIVNWANKLKENGEREHPEFFTIYSNVKMLQKVSLKKRALGRFNPVGALSLLRFDHGAMETSKQVHVGDKNEPLVITIVEEVKNVATD